MQVKDVMKTDVAFCAAEDNLRKVAETMLRRDCGVVLIVDAENRIVGMLTDRDLCLIVVARNRKASDVAASEIINSKTITCSPEDKIEDALRKMRKHQIKRLAAIDGDGKLAGILSVTDILLFVRKNKDLKKKIDSTLKAIAKPRPIVLHEIAAAEI